MFVLASNHFQKCFSVNAGVWLRMENKFFGSYLKLTVCFSWFDPEIGFSGYFHFKPFPDSRTKREREREREKESPDHSSDRALVRQPQTKLQSRRTAPHQRRPTPTPIHTSTDQAKIDSNADRTTSIDSKVQRPTTAPIADRTAPIKQRSTPTPLDLASTARSRLRLCRAISPLDRT